VSGRFFRGWLLALWRVGAAEEPVWVDAASGPAARVFQSRLARGLRGGLDRKLDRAVHEGFEKKPLATGCGRIQNFVCGSGLIFLNQRADSEKESRSELDG
jgi:hypothetical protein